MVEELRQLLESIRPEKCVPNDLLFQRMGQPIKRFDKAWATACYKAGIGVRYIEKKVLIDPQEPAKGKRVVLYKNGPKKGRPIMLRCPAIYFHDMRPTAYEKANQELVHSVLVQGRAAPPTSAGGRSLT